MAAPRATPRRKTARVAIMEDEKFEVGASADRRRIDGMSGGSMPFDPRELSGGAANSRLRAGFSGLLSKYTNVVKGWQPRIFRLAPDRGLLEYALAEGGPVRGALHLAGAVVSPSEEDGHTFTVHAASGDLFKLRAADAKERQEWITRLRVVAELHSQALSQSNSPLVTSSREVGRGVVPTALGVLDAFAQVGEWLGKADLACADLSAQVDRFPAHGSGVRCTDQELLLLRATSQATLGVLEDCLYALQLQQRLVTHPPPPPPRP